MGIKNVLITGGTGFLGSHLVKKVLETADIVVVPTLNIRQYKPLNHHKINNKKLLLIEGDITNSKFINQLFNEYEFDTVFHLAAISEVRKCQPNPKLAFDVNIKGTINILEACRKYNIKSILLSSSDKAYGSGNLPYKENNNLNGKSIYEVSKSCMDLISRSYFYNYNLPVVVTRCCNIYGPYDTNTSRIIPNTIKRIKQGNNPIIWKGSEEAVREFIYVKDVVDAYLSLVKNIDKTKGEAFNVGSGCKISIKDLVEKIIKQIDNKISIDYIGKDFPEINHQYVDTSKIKRFINWESKINLDEGLKLTINSA